jgi:hypothetical protein
MILPPSCEVSLHCGLPKQVWVRGLNRRGLPEQVIVVDVEDRDDSMWHNLSPLEGGLSGWSLLWDRWCPIPALRCAACCCCTFCRPCFR